MPDELNAQILQALNELQKEVKGLNMKMVEGLFNVDKRFEKVDERFEQIDKRFEKVDERLEQIDKRFENVDERLEQIDKRFENVDERFREADKRFDDVDEGIIKLKDSVDLLAKKHFENETEIYRVKKAIGQL